MPYDYRIKIHTLKCWPEYFDAIECGDKKFDIRKDDRGFQRGDFVHLQRTSEDNKYKVDYDLRGAVKHSLSRQIKYILTGGQFGIEAGYVILGF